jgi:hypothetical protein
MAIDFPANPEVGDTHHTAKIVYTWLGDRWSGRSYAPAPDHTEYVDQAIATLTDKLQEIQAALAAKEG